MQLADESSRAYQNNHGAPNPAGSAVKEIDDIGGTTPQSVQEVQRNKTDGTLRQANLDREARKQHRQQLLETARAAILAENDRAQQQRIANDQARLQNQHQWMREACDRPPPRLLPEFIALKELEQARKDVQSTRHAADRERDAFHEIVRRDAAEETARRDDYNRQKQHLETFPRGERPRAAPH